MELVTKAKVLIGSTVFLSLTTIGLAVALFVVSNNNAKQTDLPKDSSVAQEQEKTVVDQNTVTSTENAVEEIKTQEIKPDQMVVSKYLKARYSHMGTVKEFDYEYPYGWHVNETLFENGGSAVNVWVMDNKPLEGSDAPVLVNGTSIDSTSSLFIESYYANQNSAIKKNYNLHQKESFCYGYKDYDGQTGNTNPVIACVMKYSNSAGFQVKLNDVSKEKDFQHIVESIKF